MLVLAYNFIKIITIITVILYIILEISTAVIRSKNFIDCDHDPVLYFNKEETAYIKCEKCEFNKMVTIEDLLKVRAYIKYYSLEKGKNNE